MKQGMLAVSSKKAVTWSHLSVLFSIVWTIRLWYEKNIIIFILFIVMDNDKRETMSMTITIFSDSVLGNTANDAAGFSFAKYVIFLAGCDRILDILFMGVDGFFNPRSCSKL